MPEYTCIQTMDLPGINGQMWTVGHDDDNGDWIAESDWDTKAEAKAEADRLNGWPATAPIGPPIDEEEHKRQQEETTEHFYAMHRDRILAIVAALIADPDECKPSYGPKQLADIAASIVNEVVRRGGAGEVTLPE